MRTRLRRGSDGIFQLSLTEIAFTTAFLLLLLLGGVVVSEQRARRAAEEALARAPALAGETRALEAARASLRASLQAAGVADPDEALRRLVAAGAAGEERDRLKRRVADLEARLSALAELQRRVQQAASSAGASGGEGGEGGGVTPEAIVEGLQLREAVRRVLGAGAGAGAGPGAASGAASSAGSPTLVARWQAREQTQADLRGQVAFLRNRLEARGGRDYPPCWADASGHVDFLFSIELQPAAVVVRPAWPPSRDAEARAMPGVADVIARPFPLADFPARMAPIREASRRRDPECRHYVQLRSTIADAVASDRARWVVENDFYKVEARR